MVSMVKRHCAQVIPDASRGALAVITLAVTLAE